MSSLILLFATLLIAQHEIKGQPVDRETGVTYQRNTKVLHHGPREWSHFQHSWSLPSFPSLSVSSLFKDDEKEVSLKKRLEALEKSQKNLYELLKKLVEAPKPACETPTSEKPLSNKPSKSGNKVQGTKNDDTKQTTAPPKKEGTPNKETAEPSKKGENERPSAPSKENQKPAPVNDKKEESDKAPEKTGKLPANEDDNKDATSSENESGKPAEEVQTPQIPPMADKTESNKNEEVQNNKETARPNEENSSENNAGDAAESQESEKNQGNAAIVAFAPASDDSNTEETSRDLNSQTPGN